MQLEVYLRRMCELEASDLYLTTGAAPTAKVQGEMVPLDEERLDPERVRAIAEEIMSPEQREEFERTHELNLALSVPGVGRFRVNLFHQRNQPALVARHIKTEIPDFKSLGLPPVLTKLVMQKRGLVLFVGGTGSGKSTSLASLIDFRNTHAAGHIITIEDPVEFMHRHKKSIVNQREVGIDTVDYAEALKNTLRQAPDVILIGEIRDRDTMEHALAFSQTGHLVLSTLHATNASQTFERILSFFPEDRHAQIRMDLSFNLRGIVSQRLVNGRDRQRVVAVEVLLVTPRVADVIHKGDFHLLPEIIEKSTNLGMQSFDQALYELHKAGRIDLKEALRNADSPNNLRLKVNLESGTIGHQANKLSLRLDDDPLDD